MRTLRALASRLKGAFRRARDERDFEAQIQADIALHVEDAIRAGASPEEARRQALVKFGGLDAAREAWRDRRGLPFLETLVRDIAHALRVLGRNKGWSAVAIASLALGVGATAAVFSAANALLLRKMPVPDPDSIVTLRWEGQNRTMTSFNDYGFVPNGAVPSLFEELTPDYFFNKMKAGVTAPYPTFQRLSAVNTTLAQLFAVGPGPTVNLIVDGKGDTASSQFVSGGFYATAAVPPAAGRLILASDDRKGAAPVGVLSYPYWQQRFGGDQSVVGKHVRINTAAFTIVGVSGPLQPDMIKGWPSPPDLTIALVHEPLFRHGESRLDQATNWWLVMMGRLRPGVTAEQVQANLAPAYDQATRDAADSMLATLSGDDLAEARDFGFGEKIPRLHVVSGARGAYDPMPMFQAPLAILAVLVGIVLMVVCVNLGNLSMALTTSRERELAVRRAIGATPRRVVRQILTEHLVVAVLGGAASLLIAYLFQDLMRLYFTADFDGAVVAFAFAVAVATGLLIGIAPALRAARAPAAVPAWGGPLRRSRATSLLLVAQVTMSLVLLIGAGLFTRTLLNLRSVNPGFDADRLVIFTIDPAFNQYDPAKTTTLYDELTTRLRALPGVSSVSFSSHAMLDGSVNRTLVSAEGTLNRAHSVDSLVVGPAFFETMRIPVRSGRVFDQRDSASGPKVVIVNEALARVAFGEANPVGRRFDTDAVGDEGDASKNTADTEIVGVVADTRHSSLRAAPAQMFLPHAQSSSGPRTFEVRTRVPPEGLMPAIRKVVEAADSALPIISLSTQATTIENQRAKERIIALASSTLGGLTLVVSMIGLFGLLSYAVTRRTRDIAVRMALGAPRRDVLRSVLGEALIMVGIGTAIGLGVAVGTTHFLESLLFGLPPNDPLVLGGAVVMMLVVAAAAAYLPARRAADVDPMVALRQE
jgi:predicted permease